MLMYQTISINIYCYFALEKIDDATLDSNIYFFYDYGSFLKALKKLLFRLICL